VTELKRINVRLTPEMYGFLKTKAEERGLSMNAMIILALETYLTQMKTIDYIPEMLKELSKERD